jgi:hypothetical protein
MNHPCFITCALLHVAALTLCRAQQPAVHSNPGNACSSAEFRQFDFWMGRWSVTDSSGNPMGRSEITREADGCGILEHWTGGDGISGTSINYYDRHDGRWHQDWVGGGGGVLHLSGGIEGKAMVMTGEREGPRGHVTDRISWEPLPDGRVKQEWTLSSDGGRSWKRVFLGFYTRS